MTNKFCVQKTTHGTGKRADSYRCVKTDVPEAAAADFCDKNGNFKKKRHEVPTGEALCNYNLGMYKLTSQNGRDAFFCGQNFKANDELLFFSFFSFAPSVPPFPPFPPPLKVFSVKVSKVEGGSKRVVSSGRVVGFTRVVISRVSVTRKVTRECCSQSVCARAYSL